MKGVSSTEYNKISVNKICQQYAVFIIIVSFIFGGTAISERVTPLMGHYCNLRVGIQ